MDAREYYDSDMATEDAASALRNWRLDNVVSEYDMTHVTAQAKTGSRYEVAVTTMPSALEGGTMIAVLAPWTAVKVTTANEVSRSYVMEHLRDLRRDPGPQHMGDIAALTATINEAMKIHYFIPVEENKCRNCT